MTKILYVEDNKDTAKAVKIILNAVGYDVELAFTGKEGLKKLKKGKFDLVILDNMLPDITGIEIFGKIKHDKKCKYAFLTITPVSLEKLENLKKEGVADYISKPFKKNDLIKRVQKILNHEVK